MKKWFLVGLVLILGSLQLFIHVTAVDHQPTVGSWPILPDELLADAELAEPAGVDWPKDAQGLIGHLNRWDKFSLDLCERPEQYPGVIDSGETVAWIYEHKVALARLGVKVRWSAERMQYEVPE